MIWGLIIMIDYIYKDTNIIKMYNAPSLSIPSEMVEKCNNYLNLCSVHIGTIKNFFPYVDGCKDLVISIREQFVYLSDGCMDTCIGKTDNCDYFQLPLFVASNVLKEAFKYLKDENEVELYMSPHGTLIKFVGSSCIALCAMKKSS